MAHIPKELIAQLISDPFYDQCCITGQTPCQFHHNFEYGRNQVQEKWCILPLHKDVHDKARNKAFKVFLDWIMLSRATDEELSRYSKVERLIDQRKHLQSIFGTDISPRKIKKLYENNYCNNATSIDK